MSFVIKSSVTHTKEWLKKSKANESVILLINSIGYNNSNKRGVVTTCNKCSSSKESADKLKSS